MDPKALAELIPDWKERDDFPVERWVEREEMVMLRPGGGKFKAPWLPPEMQNHGKPIISLGKLCKWLGEIAEEKGVNIFPGFAGAELLWDGDSVNGVRTGDRGVDKDGTHKDEYEPGMDLTSPVTILGEGPRGFLSKQLIAKKELDKDSNPMAYEVGVKRSSSSRKAHLKKGLSVMALDIVEKRYLRRVLHYTWVDTRRDWPPRSLAKDCMDALPQKLKCIRNEGLQVQEGGEIRCKTSRSVDGLPTAATFDGAVSVGWYSIPQHQESTPIKSGMWLLTAFQSLVSGDNSAETLKPIPMAYTPWIETEMEPSKSLHADFEGGLFGGLVKTGMSYFFGKEKDASIPEDHAHMNPANNTTAMDDIERDGTYLVDKLTSKILGTVHEEQQPCHLVIADTEICATKCLEEYGNPCTVALQVYNMHVETGAP